MQTHTHIFIYIYIFLWPHRLHSQEQGSRCRKKQCLVSGKGGGGLFGNTAQPWNLAGCPHKPYTSIGRNKQRKHVLKAWSCRNGTVWSIGFNLNLIDSLWVYFTYFSIIPNHLISAYNWCSTFASPFILLQYQPNIFNDLS